MKRRSSGGPRRMLTRLLLVWTAALAAVGFAAATASATDNTVARFVVAQADWHRSTSTSSSTVVLDFQFDGNLVVYHGSTPLWASGTNGRGVVDLDWSASGFVRLKNSAGTTICTIGALTPAPGGTARLQDDGNFVFYNTAGHATWASNTSGFRQGNRNYCFT